VCDTNPWVTEARQASLEGEPVRWTPYCVRYAGGIGDEPCWCGACEPPDADVDCDCDQDGCAACDPRAGAIDPPPAEMNARRPT
jgi:hypothetical protein